MTAFVWTLVAGAIGEGTLYSKDVWLQALAAGAVAGVTGVVWLTYLGPWVATYSRPIFLKVRDAVNGTLTSWKGWIGDKAGTAAGYAFALFTYVADNLSAVTNDIARRAG